MTLGRGSLTLIAAGDRWAIARHGHVLLELTDAELRWLTYAAAPAALCAPTGPGGSNRAEGVVGGRPAPARVPAAGAGLFA